MNGPVLYLRVFLRECLVAVLTGVITFGISVVLLPGAYGAAAVFAVVAATAAGGLDTLFFHLLYRLQRAPAYVAEEHYFHGLEDTRERLLDGSLRMREALIRRFEADYRRTAESDRAEGRSRRQLKEARRRLRAREWVIDHVLTAEQLRVATLEAKNDSGALEHWSEYCDGIVDAYLQVRQRQPFGSGFANAFQPGQLAALVQKEWERLSAETH